MKEVFISYKSEEFEEASWVKSVLENNGISCWMAPESIPGGSNYALEIPRAIKECKAFVLILSSKSQSSQWVSREVDRAINEGKTVFPFMLENCELKDDFNFYLTNVQRYTAYKNKSKAIEKMLREIKALVGANKSDEEPQEPLHDDEEVSPEVIEQPKPKKKRTPKPKKEKKKVTLFNNKKRTVICAIALAAFLVLVIIIGVVKNVSNTVTIAGEKFKKDDWSIELKDKQLTADDLKKISEFYDLEGVYLTNCVFPNDDISIIFEYATNVISLKNCGLTDKHLSSVDFENLYSDIYALRLDNNPNISDLSMIEPIMGGISEISFSNCAVNDLSFLQSAYNLEKLVADNNIISDINPISICSKLQHLSLNDNKIVSLSALKEIKTLECIYVDNNELFDLSGLENSLFLDTITASNNNIISLHGLKNATQLKSVLLNNNKINDISVLSKSIEKLYKVNLSNNNLADISALSGSSELGILNIDDNELTNLDALEKCTKLDQLSAANNKISDIDGISKCVFFQLNLANNMITSTDAITFGTDAIGAKIDISNNQITNFNIKLSGNGELHFNDIRLYGNDITGFNGLEFVSASQIAIKYNENINFAEWDKYEAYKYYIIDCPLDKQVATGEMLSKYKTNFVTEQEFIKIQSEK